MQSEKAAPLLKKYGIIWSKIKFEIRVKQGWIGYNKNVGSSTPNLILLEATWKNNI
jgi:hypothetical protein